MTITSYPFEGLDTNESQYSELFREFQDSGVVGELGDQSFNISSDGAGMDVQIAPGFAILRGHAMKSDAVETVAIAPAGAQARVDRVVLRLDPVANSITLAVLTGAGGVDAPALTQTDTGIYELLLHNVYVDANAVNITGGALTDRRSYVGGRVGVWTTDTRPVTPRTPRMGFNQTLNKWEFWNGTAFVGLAEGRLLRLPHSFTISGDVKVAVGAQNFIPPYFVPVPTGQSVKLTAVRCKIQFGTSAVITLRRRSAAGTVVDIVAGLTVTQTATTTTFAAAVTVGSDDAIECVVTSISGTPQVLTASLFSDYVVS